MRKEKTLTVDQVLTRKDIWTVLENVREVAREANGIVVVVVKDDEYFTFTNMDKPRSVFYLEAAKLNLFDGGLQ